MASDTYWQRRQAEADAAMERDERSVAKRVARAYETEMASLDREIASYCERFGTDGVLSYRTMLETMDPSDRDLLMRDCDAFQEAHPDLADMVVIRKEVYKLDRLEGLQASARCHLANATAEATDGLDDHFARQAARSANAVADTMGFGRSFHSMDDDTIRAFVGTKWAGGQDYSERIWGSTDKLAGYVADDMAKAFARGDSYDRIGKTLSHRFVDVSESNVSRLIYTEGTYVARQSQAAEFEREGFETYTLSTVGDGRTCSECSSVASRSRSEPFRFEDESVGVNFPPLHPRCRCHVDPAVTDWDAWCSDQLDQERARKAAERFGGFDVETVGSSNV